jgi:hypothetical protein
VCFVREFLELTAEETALVVARYPRALTYRIEEARPRPASPRPPRPVPLPAARGAGLRRSSESNSAPWREQGGAVTRGVATAGCGQNLRPKLTYLRDTVGFDVPQLRDEAPRPASCHALPPSQHR